MPSPPDNPAFRRWFGHSKVVDASGEPLVVYHGTMAPMFSAFENVVYPDFRQQMPLGIQFAEDLGHAKQHAFEIYPDSFHDKAVDAANAAMDAEAMKLGHAGWRDLSRKAQSAPRKYKSDRRAVEMAGEYAEKAAMEDAKARMFQRVIPVYLSIQRPLDATAELRPGTSQARLAKKILGSGWQGFQDSSRNRVALLQDAINEAPGSASFPVITAAGYDGIFFTASYWDADAGEEVMRRSWAAFNPRQIKHATENVGAYDPQEPNMYKNPRRTSRRPVRRTPRGRKTSRR
jgi:hypothetical protein